MLFLLLIVVAGLLAAAVWWLQRNQRQNLRNTVERSRELPPLASSELPDFGSVATPQAYAMAQTSPPQASASPTVQASLLHPSLTTHRIETPVNIEAEPLLAPAPKAEPADNEPQTWPDQVKRLKDRGELDLAMSLCQQQFPKAQAFQQAAIVLRLQMKQYLEQAQDIEPLLTRLYRCAVLADLFRTNAAHKPANPRHALKSLGPHEFLYQQIGHRELRLLSKSDVKLLENRWGAPQQHQHGEAALGELWQNICR